MLIPLEKILAETSESIISEVFSMFSCSKDEEIESFLKQKAVLYEKKQKSRTYLLFDEEEMEKGILNVIAYFSIAMQTLKIPDDVSKTQIRKLDGLYSKKGSERITEIPAFLIGQLGKNDSSKISGDEILDWALSILSKAQSIIGGRVVFIECKDIEPLIQYYERNGFKIFRKDPEDHLIQMIRLLD